MSSETPVGPGTRVKLRFALKLESGEVVDSTGEDTAVFDVGDGNLLPRFEQAMFGMLPGESSSLLVTNGFGEHNPENIQRMQKSQFTNDMDLSEGLIVSFADQQKSELPGVVVKVYEEHVEVDFNHPLAGEDLIFQVEIVDVEQVTNDIIRV